MIQLTWSRVCWGLVWLVFAAHSFARGAAQPTAEPDAIYAYTDDLGRLVHVQRLQDVPMHLRSAARRVDAPDPQPGAAALIEWLSGVSSQPVAPEPVLYRYRGANGKEVYTNFAAHVPEAQRSAARLDLSHVSLNSQLGSALNQKLLERFEALRSSSVCNGESANAARSYWQHAWRNHRIATVCGLMVLALLALTPYMHSKGWGASWARVLWTGIPLLAFVGLSGSMLMKAESSLSQLGLRAEQCEPAAFHSAPTLAQRFSLVSALEAEQAALAQIEREGATSQR